MTDLSEGDELLVRGAKEYAIDDARVIIETRYGTRFALDPCDVVPLALVRALVRAAWNMEHDEPAMERLAVALTVEAAGALLTAAPWLGDEG